MTYKVDISRKHLPFIRSNLNPYGARLDPEFEQAKPEIMQENIFKGLKLCGWSEMPWNRYVVLSFESILCKSLNPNLHPKDFDIFPQSVLFFTIRVLNSNRVQPIGKVFFQKTVKPSIIANCIKSFIRDLMRCEYSVVATVCRPESFYFDVLNKLLKVKSLIRKTDALTYNVEHLKIVHFYDPMFLLENTFLTFLKKDVTFNQQGVDLMASYDDCKIAMVVSSNQDLMNQILESVNNFNSALRLFSMSFYGEIRRCIEMGHLKDNGSAEFCAFFNKLFDTIHGDAKGAYHADRHPLSKISTHNKIWSKSLKVLKTMECLEPSGKHQNISTNPKDGISMFSDQKKSNNSKCDLSTLGDQRVDALLQLTNQTEEGEEGIELSSLAMPMLEAVNRTLKESKNDLTTAETKNYNKDENPRKLNKINDFLDEDVYMKLKNEYIELDCDDGDNTTTLQSPNSDVKNMEDYSVKLYQTLEESEQSDSILSKDNAPTNQSCPDMHVSKYNVGFIYDSEMSQVDKLGVRHFNKYLDVNYVSIFKQNIHMPKISKYIIIDDSKNIEMKNDEMYLFNENKYVDAFEIAHSSEMTIENTEIIDTSSDVSATPLNTVIINGSLDALDYMLRQLMYCNKSEDTTLKLMHYLKKLHTVNDDIKSVTHGIIDQVRSINQSLIKIIKTLHDYNASDRQHNEACKKTRRIKKLLQDIVDSHLEKSRKSDPAKNDTCIYVKELGEYMRNTYYDINISHEGDEKMIVDSDENEEVEDIVERPTRPYIFDAWESTINGAKELFEYLQTKRFEELDMNALNLDYVRQLINNIRIENGVILKPAFDPEIVLINTELVHHIFVTNGSILFE